MSASDGSDGSPTNRPGEAIVSFDEAVSARTPFATSLATMVVLAGVLTLGPTRRNAMWVYVGLVFGVVAALLVAAHVKSVRHRRRVAADLRASRAIWDSDWSGERSLLRSGPLDAAIPRAASLLIHAMCVAGAGTAIASGNLALRVTAALVPFTVFAGVWAWSVFRGSVQVRLDRFPYLTGERAVFQVATTSGSPRLERTSVWLLCESPLPREEAPRRGDTVRWYWSAHRDLAPLEQPGPDEFAEVSFDLPADLPGTCLTAEPPVRWVLLVTGESRGGRVEERFLVPVYAPPAPSVAAPPAHG